MQNKGYENFYQRLLLIKGTAEIDRELDKKPSKMGNYDCRVIHGKSKTHGKK